MLEPADAHREQGALRSRRFGDIYHHAEDPLGAAAHVFLAGCGLPEAWRQRATFVVGELGFGAGLSALSCWRLWEAQRPPDGLLHIVSVEAYPLSRDELAAALAPHDALASQRAALLARYPAQPRAGWLRLHVADGVCLTLLFGEAAESLAELEARVDAWFLDGFAPARNPAMWSPALLAEVARLSAPGARLATYSAAGAVRRGLAEVGFAVERRPGFGPKRDMTAARYEGPPHASRVLARDRPPAIARPAAVELVGDGVAGQALVAAWGRRGIPVRWTEDARAPLPQALVMPRLSADRSAPGELFASCFRFAISHTPPAQILARGAVQAVADVPLAERRAAAWEEVELLTPAAASEAAGVPIGASCLGFPEALVIRPDRPERGPCEATPELTLLATGARSVEHPALRDVPWRLTAGQLDRIEATPASAALRCALIGERFVQPVVDGRHLIGASYEPTEQAEAGPPDPVVGEGSLAILRESFPAIAFGELAGNSWTGVRLATPDWLPLVGVPAEREAFAARFDRHCRHGVSAGDEPYPAWPRLAALTGLGSRGYTTAPLLAELLVSQLLAEPWPLPRRLATLVSPTRFLVRALRRGVQPS